MVTAVPHACPVVENPATTDLVVGIVLLDVIGGPVFADRGPAFGGSEEAASPM